MEKSIRVAPLELCFLKTEVGKVVMKSCRNTFGSLKPVDEYVLQHVCGGSSSLSVAFFFSPQAFEKFE